VSPATGVPQIIFRKREQCLVSLLGREIGARNDVLVYANCAINLAATAKQATQCKMGLDRLVVDPDHFQEMLEGLIRLHRRPGPFSGNARGPDPFARSAGSSIP
jgi:hypothetical protein